MKTKIVISPTNSKAIEVFRQLQQKKDELRKQMEGATLAQRLKAKPKGK